MKYQDIKDSNFEVRILCGDCGKKLNNSKPMTSEEMQRNWTMLVMGSGFNAPRCPKGCIPTFSDLNINTNLPIYDIKTNKMIEYSLFRFLSGRFYSNDYDKVCECEKKPKNEIYESEAYPAVHGKCGQWLEPYKEKQNKLTDELVASPESKEKV